MRVLALVVALSGATMFSGAGPATAVEAGPGQLAIDVTTPDGGPIEGDLYIYQWDDTLGEFDFFDSQYLDEPDGAAEVVLTVDDGSYYAEFSDDTGDYLTSYSNGATSAPTSPTGAGAVAVTSTAGGNADIALVAAPPPVTVTGTVVVENTTTPVAGAYVEAAGPSYDDTTTAPDGSFSLSLQPGDYDLYVGADDFEDTTATVTVPAGGGALPPIELTPVPPAIDVHVSDNTFGGPVEGASVTLENSAGGVTTLVTDASGTVSFTGVPSGSYEVNASHPDFEPTAAPVQLDYDGGYDEISIGLDVDLSCEPATPNTGLTNMGFENGLNGWTVGYETESIAVTGTDAFTSPWEGAAMARLGSSQPSSGENQPEGPNILCQDFVVDQASEAFAFNVFTYDYTGFDEFSFDLVVVNPTTGETLAAYEQGAWGQGTGLKTSGWRGVELDLAGNIGDTVRLAFRSGGTQDDLYAFWAYLDSAETLPPTVESQVDSATTASGSIMTDPVTGALTVAYPSASPSALTLTLTPECEDPALVPTSVNVALDANTFAATLVSPGVYEVTIPVEAIQNGVLTTQVTCEGEPTHSLPIGEIVLYDPSGYLTDAKTGAPIEGATVKLHKVPGWVPRGATGPYPSNSCETNLSKPPGAPWSQPAPTHLGQLINAASPEISPNVNPFMSNTDGYYGWDVAEGCWYLEVTAAGYQPITSPVVGVPTAVTDLDLKLTPLPTAACLAAQDAAKVAQAAIAPAESAVNAAVATLTKAQADLKKAKAKLKKAKANLKDAKASGDAGEIAKAEAKVKKAKAKVKKAKAEVKAAQAEVAKAQAALAQAKAALATAQAAATKACA